MMATTTTWRRLQADARARLAAAGVGNADQEARWLVADVAGAGGLDRTALATGLDRPAGAEEAAALGALVDRRAGGEPLQYVLGRWEFRRIEVAVDRRVLIPRPETEVLAGLALDEADRLGARLAVDLGTGSGALALTLAAERPRLEVGATDRSPDALAVARANRDRLGLAGRVRLLEGSWFDPLPADWLGRIDLIVANPPYVSDAEMADLPIEVRDWEPRGALCAGPTGMEDVAAIVAGAPRWLARPGALLVEMAPHQVRDASHLAERAGFGSVSVWPDLAGRDRILWARR
jgi:release factor glutamine methyltransferase